MINAINSDLSSAVAMNAAQNAPAKMPQLTDSAQNPELRKAFDSFVGETFFGQLLQSMRKTVGKPAYFNGGRAEEIFQQQLDQTLAKNLSEASADKFSGPMFELFTLQRK
jgi:Rod binding domain-containing protein